MAQYKGVLHMDSEIGTKCWWAFQDENYISNEIIISNGKIVSATSWGYDGLHILGDGDRLTIYSKEDPEEVVWEGEIKLIPLGLFTETAFGLSIDHDQKGIDRDIWARWFFDEYPALLETKESKNEQS